MRRVPRLLCGYAALALLLPGAAGAYPWPLRPFYEPHAIRGYFNDPRINGSVTSFHHGVDIVAGDLEPVYASEGGRVTARGETVAVTSRRHLLSYWHVIPAVRTGQKIRRHQLIGHIAPGAEHLHLSEFRRGVYVNPLRLGALAPYVDDTVPRISSVQFYIAGRRTQPELLSGTVDITVDAYDSNALPKAPQPWAQTRLAPALVRWRIVHGQDTLRPWTTPVDFRTYLLPPDLYSFVYAPGTYQNRPGKPGRYEYYLAQTFDTRQLTNGSYVLQVEAWDAQRNIGTAHFPFTVTNR